MRGKAKISKKIHFWPRGKSGARIIPYEADVYYEDTDRCGCSWGKAYKRTLIACAGIVFFTFFVQNGFAQSNDKIYTFNVQKDTLGGALDAIVQETSAVVFYPHKLAGKTGVNPVVGQYTLGKALELLFHNTELSGGLSEGGVVYISVSDRQVQPMEGNVLSSKASKLAAAASSMAIAATGAGGVQANDEAAANSAAQDTILVTARKREENLQEIPDAITAFTSTKIEAAGIDSIGDFTAQVPNINFRDDRAFRSGVFFMSVRGVGNGQQGWPAVTYTVDGVAADSLDAINAGSLVDVERIEVLRGPQSALYGAGAIAGAVNVITKQPTNDTELRVMGGYGKGDDWTAKALLSGALIEDKLLFRTSFAFRSWDGLIDSASTVGPGAGIDLDFERYKQLNQLIVFKPTDDLTIDLRYRYLWERNGSTYQDKLASADLIDVFDNSTRARRRFAGEDNRRFHTGSLKIDYDLDFASFTSTTAYNNVKQNVYSSVCWDDPDDPAVDADLVTPGVQPGCFNEPALGSLAGPGEIVDSIFDSADDFETVTHDSRLVSNSDSRFRWLIGAQILDRKTRTGFNVGPTVGPLENF